MNEQRLIEFCNCLPISRELGFNDWCLVTHAWNESGSFEHICGYYGYWGIKKPQLTKWEGLIAEEPTHEYEKSLANETHEQALIRLEKKYGLPVTIQAKTQKDYWYIFIYQQFVDFASPQEAITHYCNFIQRLYKPAFKNKDNPEFFFEGLMSGINQYSTASMVKNSKGVYYRNSVGNIVTKYTYELIQLYNDLQKSPKIKSLINSL